MYVCVNEIGRLIAVSISGGYFFDIYSLPSKIGRDIAAKHAMPRTVYDVDSPFGAKRYSLKTTSLSSTNTMGNYLQATDEVVVGILAKSASSSSIWSRSTS